MTTGAIVGIVFGILGALLVGAFIGFTIAKKIIKKQIKNNPPISEAQIRAMYAQMGRKPTEEQVRKVMNSYKKNATK
ncbi:MAG: YneF family protein [Mycoplasmataceae bacterium]|jgi:uncharacterized protein YneF (UPF0154 family)|nr:YneF family protein [Mycoplasmataceae bacterium]